jgi:hypothetical protein
VTAEGCGGVPLPLPQKIMAQEQEADPKRSLIARLFGSRIAEAVGIFGVVLTLFQGLEPFLEFSRFMAYLFNHWRAWTRDLWVWFASFVKLDVPVWLCDVITLAIFLLLFTMRCYRQRFMRPPSGLAVVAFYYKLIGLGDSAPSVHRQNALATLAGLWYVCVGVLVIPVSIFLGLQSSLGNDDARFWAVLSACIYAGLINLRQLRRRSRDYFLDHIARNSELALTGLTYLVLLNLIGRYSHTIEAFIEKATK